MLECWSNYVINIEDLVLITKGGGEDGDKLVNKALMIGMNVGLYVL